MKEKVSDFKKKISNARKFDELVQIGKNIERSKIDDSNLQDLRNALVEAALPHWYRIMKIKYRRIHKASLNLENRIEVNSYISCTGSELEGWAIQEIYKPSKPDNRFIAAKFLKEYVPNRYEDLPGYNIQWYQGSARAHGVKKDVYYFLTVKDRVLRHGKLRRCRVFVHRDYDKSPRVIIYDPATGYYKE